MERRNNSKEEENEAAKGVMKHLLGYCFYTKARFFGFHLFPDVIHFTFQNLPVHGKFLLIFDLAEGLHTFNIHHGLPLKSMQSNL